MSADDPSLYRRWKRFLVTGDVLDKMAKGEVSAKRMLRGARLLGSTFIHEKALIELWYERDDFPETRLGDVFPCEDLQVEPVFRIFQ